jgi:uncharacterized protein (DUF2252 family)
MKKAWIALSVAGLLLASSAQAATSRSSWVVSQVYAANHPLAATDGAELATKMATMAQSPFAFYRGTDALFYSDMRTLPTSAYTTTKTGYTWLGGDTHIGNFGAWKDSEGTYVFGVDDFDEGYLGQYVWDLRRMAASMVLAGRANGLSDSDIRDGIKTFVGSYVDAMADFKGGSDELGFQLVKGNTTGVVDDTLGAAQDDSRADLLAKYTQVTDGARVFQNLGGKLVAVSSDTYSAIAAAMNGYINSIASSKRQSASYYAVKDIHQKLGSGVGSLGKLRYDVLIEGPSSSSSDDVILEWKQEISSVVAAADNGQLPAADYDYNEGARVARTAKAQTLNADVLVGYATVNGADYYVHEKSPYQEDFDFSQLTSSGKFETAAGYLGQALASAHATADQDYDSSICPYSIDKQVTEAVSSKSGLENEIADFGFSYADQVNLDWQSFVAAYRAGTALY